MWNDLSMKGRARYIQMGVSSGITDLSVIRDTYNRYAKGGLVHKYDGTTEKTQQTSKPFRVVTDKGEILGEFDTLREARQYHLDNYRDAPIVAPTLDEVIVEGKRPTSKSAKAVDDGFTDAERERYLHNLEKSGFNFDYADRVLKADRHASQYNPENFLKATGINALDPITVLRAGYDTLTDKVDENGNPINFLQSVVEGNSGLVTDNFMRNHPIWGTATNIIGGGATIVLGNKALNLTRPLVTELYQRGKRAYDVSKLGREVVKSAKNWDGTVGPEYFNSPNKWYRVTESPEIEGIREAGKNITTRDSNPELSQIESWRLFLIKNKAIPGTGENEGYWFIPRKKSRSLTKLGSAHGNTSQAAKGQIWQGNFAFSQKFPRYVLEGDGPAQAFRGYNPITGTDSRTNFVQFPWEDIPHGARIGFHTGEMPLDGLRAFRQLPNGRYKYEGLVIPNKTIRVDEINNPIRINNVIDPARSWDNPHPITDLFHFSQIK